MNFLEAGENPDAPQDTDKSTSVIATTIDHFLHSGQFRGFSASFGRKLMMSLTCGELWAVVVSSDIRLESGELMSLRCSVLEDIANAAGLHAIWPSRKQQMDR